MKHIFFALLLLPILTGAQKNVTFKASLIDYNEKKLPPYCGDLAVATALQFRLNSSLPPYKKGQQVVVIIPCPRELGEKFYVNGNSYEITVYDKSEYKSLEKIYAMHADLISRQTKLPVFWCKKLRKAFQ